jgi:hypothetical protein
LDNIDQRIEKYLAFEDVGLFRTWRLSEKVDGMAIRILNSAQPNRRVTGDESAYTESMWAAFYVALLRVLEIDLDTKEKSWGSRRILRLGVVLPGSRSPGVELPRKLSYRRAAEAALPQSRVTTEQKPKAALS